jgi:hypothetical protein
MKPMKARMSPRRQPDFGGGSLLRGPSMRRASIAVMTVLALSVAACSPAIVPLDTKPASDGQARDLASTVASKASCGSFEDYSSHPDRQEWTFTCQRGEVPYDILVFGSEASVTAGIAQLQSDGSVFLTRDFYAVVVVPSGPTKSAALEATRSASLLDPFR